MLFSTYLFPNDLVPGTVPIKKLGHWEKSASLLQAWALMEWPSQTGRAESLGLSPRRNLCPGKNRFHFGIILFPRVKVITGSLNMVLQDLLFLPSLGRMPQNLRLPPCPSPSDMVFIIPSFRDGFPLPVFYEISICPLRSLHVTSQ